MAAISTLSNQDEVNEAQLSGCGSDTESSSRQATDILMQEIVESSKETEDHAIVTSFDETSRCSMNNNSEAQWLKSLSVFHVGRKIYVHRLPTNISEQDMLDAFSFTEVENVCLSQSVSGLTATISLLHQEMYDPLIRSTDLPEYVKGEKIEVKLSTSSNLLCITNLPEDYTEDDFGNLVAKFGPVLRCFLVYDHKSDKSKGYGMVEYLSCAVACQARSLLHLKVISGSLLHCDWVDERLVTYASLYSKSLYVDLVPPACQNYYMLREFFSVVQRPIYCQLAVKDGKMLGFGLVEYDEPEDAVLSLEECRKRTLCDSYLRICFAIPGTSALRLYTRLLSDMESKGKQQGLLPFPSVSSKAFNQFQNGSDNISKYILDNSMPTAINQSLLNASNPVNILQTLHPSYVPNVGIGGQPIIMQMPNQNQILLPSLPWFSSAVNLPLPQHMNVLQQQKGFPNNAINSSKDARYNNSSYSNQQSPSFLHRTSDSLADSTEFVQSTKCFSKTPRRPERSRTLVPLKGTSPVSIPLLISPKNDHLLKQNHILVSSSPSLNIEGRFPLKEVSGNYGGEDKGGKNFTDTDKWKQINLVNNAGIRNSMLHLDSERIWINSSQDQRYPFLGGLALSEAIKPLDYIHANNLSPLASNPGSSLLNGSSRINSLAILNLGTRETPIKRKRDFFLPSPEPSPSSSYIGQHSQGIGGLYLGSHQPSKRKKYYY